ncbi:MAG: WavE lipopolysaccharide synthesis family protein [Terrimicrobiaceae bacterium]
MPVPELPPPDDQGSNIGVMVQGPVAGKGVSDRSQAWSAADCVRSVRAILPEARIILSTWKGSDLTGIECDEIIENPDPGIIYNATGCVHNFTRQMESTRAGLRALAGVRPYAIKMRTDMLLTGRGFLRQFQAHRARAKEFQVLEDRIVGFMYFTRHLRRGYFLFCWSDLIHFGRTADLLRLWDIPCFPVYPKTDKESGKTLMWTDLNLLPEQYIWSQLFRDQLDISQFRDVTHRSPHLDAAHDLALINNFLPLEPATFGTRWVGRKIHIKRQMNTFTEGEIEGLYRKVCDPGHTRMKSWNWRRAGKEALFAVARVKDRLSGKAPQ